MIIKVLLSEFSNHPIRTRVEKSIELYSDIQLVNLTVDSIVRESYVWKQCDSLKSFRP